MSLEDDPGKDVRPERKKTVNNRRNSHKGLRRMIPVAPRHISAVTIALGSLTWAACDTMSGQARRAEGRRQAVAIETTAPQRIVLERQVDLSGTIMSPDQAKVSSEV